MEEMPGFCQVLLCEVGRCSDHMLLLLLRFGSQQVIFSWLVEFVGKLSVSLFSLYFCNTRYRFLNATHFLGLRNKGKED